MTRARDNSVNPFNNNYAGKNFVINGGMDFFQRGSLSTTSGGYGLDRWAQVSSGSGSNVTITQQTTGVPFGSRYCARITMGASAGYGNQFQYIETSNVTPLVGKTATFSIKLRRSSSFAGTLSVVVAKSATVDAGGGASWTALTPRGVSTATNSALPTGTTSSDWLTIAFQVDIPNDGSANSLRVSVQQSQVETSAYWEMAQAQLEVGSFATPFSRAGGDIQGELAKCQRYYETNYPVGLAPGYNMPDAGADFASISLSAKMGVTGTTGSNRSRSEARVFAVQKRSTPTIQYWDWVGNLSRYSGGNFDGSRSNDNLTVDTFGGPGISDKSIAFQTVSASSSIVFAGIMWAASSEL